MPVFDPKVKQAPMSSGVIGPGEVYELQGVSGVKGAIEGNHQVTVMCPMILSDPSGANTPKVPCNIPLKYSNVAESGLTATVTGPGPASIDFDLKLE